MKDQNFYSHLIALFLLINVIKLSIGFQIKSCNSNKIDQVEWIGNKSVIRYNDSKGIKPNQGGMDVRIWCESDGSLITNCQLQRIVDEQPALACSYSIPIDCSATKTCQPKYKRIKFHPTSSNTCEFRFDLLKEAGNYH